MSYFVRRGKLLRGVLCMGASKIKLSWKRLDAGRAAAMWAGLLALALNSAVAQVVRNKPTSDEPTDFSNESVLLAAPMRCAMCCALSPDEKWVATGYGRWAHVGQVCVWDVVTGKIRWHANEERGVRAIAVSPDGAFVASGNYGG